MSGLSTWWAPSFKKTRHFLLYVSLPPETCMDFDSLHELLFSLLVCYLSPSATPQAKNSLKLHSATPGSFVHTAKIRSNEHIKKLFLNFFLQQV
jgi:hypothetical protein